MKDRPIIFRGDGVLGILEDRKTNTRRVIKPQPNEGDEVGFSFFSGNNAVEFRNYQAGYSRIVKCPYETGMKLWVRETWAPMCRVADPFCECDEEAAKANHFIEYKADTGNPLPGDWPEENRDDEGCPKWRSPIFMPRQASRITLEIVNVRVERIQDITPDDAMLEGVNVNINLGEPDYLSPFRKLWNSINQKRGFGWDTNPWCWVLEFKRINP
jgi:hypothetical protein